jgi:hypothetical protein
VRLCGIITIICGFEFSKCGWQRNNVSELLARKTQFIICGFTESYQINDNILNVRSGLHDSHIDDNYVTLSVLERTGYIVIYLQEKKSAADYYFV